MGKLEISRQNVFASRNSSGDTFYYLILGTSNYGCIHIRIKDTPAFKDIPGLKIDNIGYACINNIQHTPWRRFNFKHVINYRRLNDREYSQITNAIHDYMNGIIGFADDCTMHYTDEIALYNANHALKNSPITVNRFDESSHKKESGGVKEFDETATVIKSDSKSDNTPVEEILIEEEPVIEVELETITETEKVKSEDEAIIEETKPEDEPVIEEVKLVDEAVEEPKQVNEEIKEEALTEVVANEEPIVVLNDISEDGKSATDIILEENNTKEEAKIKGIKCYNLITSTNTTPYYVKSKEAAHKSTTQLGKRIYRHIYTEEETFEIAHLETKCISIKYNVSAAVASHMKATAKKIYDIERDNRAKAKNYINLFKMGISVEEVAKITDTDINTVNRCYTYYNINKNIDKEATPAVVAKWKNAIKNNEIDKLLEVVDMSCSKFAEMENISVGTSNSIIANIRDHILRNPLVAIGVDSSTAFNEDKITEMVDRLRNTAGLKSSSKEINNAKVWIIEKALSLRDAYADSYDDHIDIMHGIKPIPESVNKKDRDAFITMITNRFYMFRMASTKRNFTADQSYVMNNTDSSVAEIMMAFMCTDTQKARRIKHTIRDRNKNAEAKVLESAV